MGQCRSSVEEYIDHSYLHWQVQDTDDQPRNSSFSSPWVWVGHWTSSTDVLVTRTCHCPVPFANTDRCFSFDSFRESISYFIPGIFRTGSWWTPVGLERKNWATRWNWASLGVGESTSWPNVSLIGIFTRHCCEPSSNVALLGHW